MKRKHSVPKGYRQLKAGEKIKAEDIMNAKDNTHPFITVNKWGFLSADAHIGFKIETRDSLAYYRKFKEKKGSK